MVRTNPDALAAVYASFIYDTGLAMPYSDCFRGASLDAVGASFALCFVQCYGMKVFAQLSHLFSIAIPSGNRPHAGLNRPLFIVVALLPAGGNTPQS